MAQIPWNKGKGKKREPKRCRECGKTFTAKYRVTDEYWENRKFCSHKCSERHSVGRESSNRGRIRVPLLDRFWRKIDKNGPIHPILQTRCWIWAGAKEKNGYGKLFRCRPARFYKTHRLSWEIHYGAIPDGLGVLHKCDVPLCVNPQHLFLGTFADNMQDKLDKGRGADHHGENNTKAKLTESDVRSIRKMRSRGMTQQNIADIYRISQSAIWSILAGKTWANVK